MASIPRQQKISQSMLPLVVVLLGPTASGKTAWGVKLAKKFVGEIISADSRQVYQGMDIGTGKDKATYGRVPVHGLDLVSPKKQYTVVDWQRYAYQIMPEILRRHHLPIIVGGTGLYLRAVTRGYVFPKSDPAIRQKLARKTLPQLLRKLSAIDRKTYLIIDRANRRRVERAVEISIVSGQSKMNTTKPTPPPYRFCVIGIRVSQTELHRRIHRRLIERIEREGMIAEVEQLHQAGVSWKKLDNFGLEYRWISRFLRGQIDFETMLQQLEHDIQQFAKRQLTWWRKDTDIVWVNSYQQAEKLVKKFNN